MVPKTIINNLEEEKKNNPMIKVSRIGQIYNYLQQVRYKSGKLNMDFGELYAWCTANDKIPTDKDEMAFVYE